MITRVMDDHVQISEVSVMELTTKLGTDAVASFTSDPARSVPGSFQYGLLLLKVQMYIQGINITVVPCPQPGQRVPPPTVRIVDQQVDLDYPVASALQRRLESDGYRTSWVAPST